VSGDEGLVPGRGRVGSFDAEQTATAELVRRASSGDARAIDLLFTRFRPVLRRWATGRLPAWAREHVDTDDMIQDTFLRTFRNLPSFEPRRPGAFGAYLRRSLDNRVRDEIRRVTARPRRVELSEDDADPAASPLEEAIGADALRRYEQALKRLRDDERELVLMRLEMGVSYRELASLFGKPSEDAARMAVSRALLRLATEMDDEG